MVGKFLEQLHADLFDAAHDAENGGLRLTALLHVLFDRLEEAGVISGGQIAFYRQETANLHAEVHGYVFDSEEDEVSLFYCIDANSDTSLGDSPTAQPTGKDEIDRAFRRLEGFLKLVRTGRATNVEESQPAHELVELLADTARSGRAIALHVVTTGTISDRAAIFAAKDGVAREVWDLTRLTRTCGITGDDKLSIDFSSEFQKTLPCLVTDRAPDGIQVLFTCIPGAMLAQIYTTFRARLLERNVRSFLQFNGKINKGIRDTLLNSPSRFLPYNNGLSATASRVELESLDGGLARIRAVHDFQIVNGGQTTASIAATARRDGADLAQVIVPMKLTVVPAGQVDELVPLISKFANTQNRIQEADFSANHPWHIEMERISRGKWTQPSADSPRGTRWFYERSRGQYADELAAQNSGPGRKRFRNENPPRQKITKTELAKFVMSWDQRPAMVSKGAQKCFMEFMSQLVRDNKKAPSTEDFERIVAQAILFDAAERLYGELDFQGYRAQVVTYSIARLSHALQRKLPWQDMWKNQRVPDELAQSLKTILIGVRNIILQPPNNRNITEWCKREECWSKVLNLQLDLGLPASAQESTNPEESKIEIAFAPGEKELIAAAKAFPADVWFTVSGWAKETQSLKPWQRAIAFSLGRLSTQAKSPSAKQSRQGCVLVLEAHRLGFTHDQLTKNMVNAAKTAIENEKQ